MNSNESIKSVYLQVRLHLFFFLISRWIPYIVKAIDEILLNSQQFLWSSGCAASEWAPQTIDEVVLSKLHKHEFGSRWDFFMSGDPALAHAGTLGL